MKIRNGFVSNSSSSSFMIQNISQEDKTLIEFVKENLHLVDQFNKEYRCLYTHDQMIESAERYWQDYDVLKPGQEEEWTFGDEDGTVVGKVFDYILRDGGTSKSFDWEFCQFYR